MTVHVDYSAPLAALCGVTQEDKPIESGTTVEGLLAELAIRHGEPLAEVLTGGPSGVSPLLVSVNGEMVLDRAAHTLQSGDLVLLFAGISGG
ncbi:MAG: MoaD/ThiS family protein [Planctomycetota bacterium]